jgi:hypothetical protein
MNIIFKIMSLQYNLGKFIYFYLNKIRRRLFLKAADF